MNPAQIPVNRSAGGSELTASGRGRRLTGNGCRPTGGNDAALSSRMGLRVPVRADCNKLRGSRGTFGGGHAGRAGDRVEQGRGWLSAVLVPLGLRVLPHSG